MSVKVRIEVEGGCIVGVTATAPVDIQFVDYDCDLGNATVDGREVRTWRSVVVEEDTVSDEQFTSAITYI